ncbi:hypothetical protein HG536_0C00290 [Torulaspora globosa]|uniref:BRCT domain-containing protein n=1 Tax=Torulaspora globosa TaxID=48254 RepID=A0A7G3ZEC6_9SACH|nr:uncharacterized protein HG536_0C00290 [Torulaspora globosa]QLL31862.1 hypothetical protein HG536_0C00290 [Torulaspora globosa]
MLAASSPRADESGDSRDPVTQETPVASRSFSKGDESKLQTIYDGANHAEPVECRGTEELQLIERATPHTPLLDDRNGEAPQSWESHTIRNDKVDNQVHKHEIRYNKRTPNLDRIAKFLKGNRTPGDDNFQLKFDVSGDDDTPLSKRHEDSPVNRGRRESAFDHSLNHRLGRTKSTGGDGVVIRDFGGHDSTGFTAGTNGSPKARNKASSDRRNSFNHSDAQSSFIKPSRPRLPNLERRTVLSEEDGSHIGGVKETGELSKEQKDETGRSIVGLSGADETSKELQNAAASHLQEDRTVDYSHIDDTTEGIPEMWVLRPNDSDVFNSNKSTQVINTTDTQVYTKESPNRANEDREISFIKEPVEVPSQVIASQNDTVPRKKEANIGSMSHEFGVSTQIIQSPEEILSNSLETPKTFPKINFEPIMEVPETSSPSKSREIGLEGNSSPSPRDWDRKRTSIATQIDDSTERVRLQISSKAESPPSNDENSQAEAPTASPDTVVVLSDIEVTQELPEIEEDAAQAKSSLLGNTYGEQKCDDDQVITSRKRREAETVELIVEQENRSSKTSPTKKVRPSPKIRRDESEAGSRADKEHLTRESQTSRPPEPIQDHNYNSDRIMSKLPTDIRYSDEEYLSKNDIRFEDAVWCQYSLDYRYYPGRIAGYEEESESYWVYFETGKSLTKSEDIYYLDIRVGDIVTFGGKKYQVVGLESRDNNEDAIRCIRGYDTVHLKRRKKTGSLGQKTIIKPLASASLDLTEWTKRPKIILDNGFHTKAKAYQALQHPIRGRKSNATSSPRKVKSTTRKEQSTRPVYKEESDEETNLVREKNSQAEHSSLDLVPSWLNISEQKNNESCKVFENCLFVLTGLNEDRQQLCDVIESQGGEILQIGFSELFEYELQEHNETGCILYALQLEWRRKFVEKKYRFACLITRRHLRSLKYLEALALGWPTLHWKFIRACLQRGRICVESIHQFLLPSGESYRLSFEPSTKNGIIKSNNIYQFYSKLLQGHMLEAQVHAMREQMDDYVVILYGRSELDHFIRFALACLGVAKLYHIQGRATTTFQEEVQQINGKLADLQKENDNLKVVIYVNRSSSISSALLEDMRQQISLEYRDITANGFEFHVEAKEWLIQTIINGAAGFNE